MAKDRNEPKPTGGGKRVEKRAERRVERLRARVDAARQRVTRREAQLIKGHADVERLTERLAQAERELNETHDARRPGRVAAAAGTIVASTTGALRDVAGVAIAGATGAASGVASALGTGERAASRARKARRSPPVGTGPEAENGSDGGANGS